jgi:hypothetical protein
MTRASRTFAIAVVGASLSAFCTATGPEARQDWPDAEVMSACVDGIAADLSKEVPPQDANVFLIMPHWSRNAWYLSDTQFQSDLMREDTKWETYDAAAPLLRAIRARGSVGGPVPPLAARHATRLLTKEESDDPHVLWDLTSLAKEPSRPPDGVWLEFSPPGYAADRTTALVRGFFGPTPHGATFTCFVERSGPHWFMKWSRLSFYA